MDLPKMQTSVSMIGDGKYVEVDARVYDAIEGGPPVDLVTHHEYVASPGWFERVILRDTWDAKIERAKEHCISKVKRDLIQR